MSQRGGGLEPPITLFEPGDMAQVVFALTPDSVAVGIGTAGALMLGLIAVWYIGFKVLRKFITRMAYMT